MFYNVKTLIKDIYTYPLEYKLEIRKWFISSSKEKLSLKIIFSCFPILFSISKLFYLKYQDETATNIFKKNLPGISSHQVKMLWQTFEHVYSDQLKFETLRVPHSFVNTIEASKKNTLNLYPEKTNLEFIIDSCFKRIDFYNDSVLIKTNSNWNKKQPQLYTGIFNNLNYNTKKFLQSESLLSRSNPAAFASKTSDRLVLLAKAYSQAKGQIGSNWHTISTKDFSRLQNENKNFYSDLDELPLKLQHICLDKNPIIDYDQILINIPIKQIKFAQKYQKIIYLFEHSSSLSYEQLNNKTQKNRKVDKLKIKLLPQKIKQISEFFPNQKIFNPINTSETLSMGLKLEPSSSLLGVENFVFYPIINSSNVNVENISELVSVKNEIIHTKLKKNFYNKNRLPFQTNVILNFVPQNINFESFEFVENEPTNSEITIQKNLLLTEKGTALLNKLEHSSSETSLQLVSPAKASLSKDENNLINTLNIQEIVPWILNTNQSLDLLEFAEEFSLIRKNSNIVPRIMSGYRLADIDNKSNALLLEELFYKTNNRLFGKIYKNFIEQTWNPTFHINLSKNPFYPIEFLNTKLHLPSFKLLSKMRNIIYFEKNIAEDGSVNYIKKTYEVPCVLWDDSINEFDIKNNDSLRKWVTNFFYSDNPLSDRRETFFGTNAYAFQENNDTVYKNKTESYVKVPLIKHGIVKHNKKTSVGKKSFREVRLFKAMLIPDKFPGLDDRGDRVPKKNPYKEIIPPYQVIPGIEYPYIQYLDELGWETFLKEMGEEVNEMLPLSYIQHPKCEFINWPLNQFDSLELGFSETSLPFGSEDTRRVASIQLVSPEPSSSLNLNKFKFILKKNNLIINYHYFPCSQTLKAYKKNYTIYNKVLVKDQITFNNNQKFKITSQPKTYSFANSFYECIEPLNSDSWLFITQFSVGLFLITLLQIILKKNEGEIRYVISSFLENGESQSKDFNRDDLEKNNENFRIINNIQTKFHDIAGIDSILPELSEIVWFLKNSGRSFKLFNLISQAILLTGPPGTGKTLLVQAIAGEAEVPVLMESGSALNRPETSESGPERLKNLFERARKMAPCIVFIDEIDTFGEARDQVLENSIVNDTILDSIYPNIRNSTENLSMIENLDFIPQPNTGEVINEKNENFQSTIEIDNLNNSSSDLFNEINQNIQIESKTKQDQRNLLMQFLIELDGIATNKKIMVFGATNRPQILDAALTRPGRFNKILELKLPNKQKRLEILKFYSKNLGVDKTISWNYLANLTLGLSAADLAAVMNQSSMKAIQTETFHTIQTIEYGIESIIGYTTQKNQLKTFSQSLKNSTCNKFEPSLSNSSLFANRLAYYQSGKAIIHTLLKHHPSVISIHLWPQLKNTRYHLMNGIVEKEFSQIYTRIELESRIIGLYGGKAAELLALFHGFKLHPNESGSKFGVSQNLDQSFNNFGFSCKEKSENKHSTKFKLINTNEKFLYFAQSDLGIQDISLASWLAQIMVTKWYFYSKKISTEKFTKLQENLNLENILNPAIFEFLEQFSHGFSKGNNYLSSSTQENTKKISAIQENSQNWITQTWLQKQIINKLEFSFFRENNWFKIYGGDHEKNENTRVIPPDEYYHGNVGLNNLLHSKLPLHEISLKIPPKSSLTWNDVSNLNRDYIYHSLIMACFNKAVCILDENRELMDLFASSLMQKEIIREHEISNIIKKFKENKMSSITKNTVHKTSNKNNRESKIIEKSWGNFSQKKACRFVNFKKINTI